MEKSDIAGTWVNELNSTVKIESCSPDGKICEKFISGQGETMGKEKPIVGFWNKDKKIITFSVMYENFMTTWMGIVAHAGSIDTTWFMQKSDSWNGKLTGYNSFKLKP